MLKLDQIREDLKNIRYYYSRKELLDKAMQYSGKSQSLLTVDKYSNAIQYAPPRLLDVYYSLYINNHTQKSFADELGVTPDYVYKLNKELLLFFQKQLAEVA